MRGNARVQAVGLFKESGINCIGSSRHEAKLAAVEAGAKTSSEIGAVIGIHSFNTAKVYLNLWEQVGEFVRGEGIKDLEKLTPELVGQFLEEKANLDVSWQTFTSYSAACQKLGQTLTLYSEKMALRFESREARVYDFSAVIQNVRDKYRDELERFTCSRRYDDPQALKLAIEEPKHQLAAAIQHESGVRVTEMSLIRAEQLKGFEMDPHTGKEVGRFSFRGKGGYRNVGNLDRATYEKLESYIREQGEFRVDQEDYRNSLKSAATMTGQDYTGSHGLRWSFASARMLELGKTGMKHEAALATVSTELSHHRISITEHYLR